MTRINDKQTLSKESFIRLLSLIDKIYGEMMPLGSVVQINKSMLSEDYKEIIDDNSPIYVLITGRRVIVENKFYLDYVGYFWPNGMIENHTPIIVSGHMIESILSYGLENEVEKLHILNLRRKVLGLNIDSFLFHRYLTGV